MLILSRKLGESICVGDDIQVIVLKNKNNQVQIGIEAPKSVAVHRHEVFERIQKNKKLTSLS